LCGEHGIEPLPLWGQSDPKGDFPELMKRVQGNVEWWNKQLLELGVDQAALVVEPDPLVTEHDFHHLHGSLQGPSFRRTTD